MAARRSRARFGVAQLLFSAALCASAGACASASTVPPMETPIPDDEPTAAFYTAEQAAQGERVFSTVCSACHGRNEFTGPIFGLTWRVEPVGHLFEHVRTTMPQDRPGSLDEADYVAIVAYFLGLNGRPPGEQELPADAGVLDRMRW